MVNELFEIGSGFEIHFVGLSITIMHPWVPIPNMVNMMLFRMGAVWLRPTSPT